MFGSDILDVFIGLSFTYFFLSLICMWIQDIISWFRQLKAKHVVSLIQNLLDVKQVMDKKPEKRIFHTSKGDPWEDIKEIGKKIRTDIVKTFFEQPIIKSLAGDKKLPQKITGTDFSAALFDILKQAGTAGKANAPVTTEVLKIGAEKIESPSTKSAVTSIIETAETTGKDDTEKLNIVRADLASWFNAVKDQASLWYKKKIQISVIIIAIIVAAGFNADTLDMFRLLWNQPMMRESLSEIATAYVNKEKENKEISTPREVTEIVLKLDELKSVNSLLGWDTWIAGVKQKISSQPDKNPIGSLIFFKIIGILITAFGISQGSSFWYDAIKRLITLRDKADKDT